MIPIPLPPRQSLSVSPVNSNPFDVVERQIAPSDPFECAFQSALTNGYSSKDNVQTPNSDFVFNSEDKQTNGWSTANVEKTNETPKYLCEKISALTIPESVKNDKSSGQLLSTKSPSISVVVSEADSQSHISGDLSLTEEGLKAVIAKRVNKCIQKVLNNTLTSKLNHNEVVSKTNVNRRSLSFVMDSKKNVTCDRLNKSCADSSSNNDPFHENHNLLSPDASSLGLCDMDLMNLTPGEVNQFLTVQSLTFSFYRNNIIVFLRVYI